MNERERLVELLFNIPPMNINIGGRRNGKRLMTMQHLADHLLDNGVIVPPCKVGDAVYPLNADLRFRAFIERIEITAEGLCFEWAQYDVGVDCTECWDDGIFALADIGKTVFLDEAERLKALAERG